MSMENQARIRENPKPLVEFAGVSVKYGDKEVLRDLTWSLEPGRNWAVLGANGSGKSTLLRLIRGDIMPNPGQGSWAYHVRGRAQRTPIGFKQETRLVSSDLLDAYRRNNWNLPCLEVVLSGLDDTVYLQDRPSPVQTQAALAALERAGLDRLARAGITTLSQGQAKRVLLTRALMARPRVLLLDELCEGLDGASRKGLLEQVQEAAQEGIQVVQAVHRVEELIPATGSYLSLGWGRVMDQGGLASLKSPARKRKPAQAAPFPTLRTADLNPGPEKKELFRLRGVDVFINNRPILRNLNWTVRQGQHWAVLGPNGSGKSTLMRLLAGDLRTALGGVVVRFSDPKLKNLWHLRQRISLVSAHYQAAHKYPESALKVVLGGFKGGIGVSFEPEPEQVDRALHWLEFFGLKHAAKREITGLSYGQQRRVLLAKAMVIEPEILLLDESTGGLDAASRKEFLDMIQELAAQGRTLIQASHYPDELAPCLTHAARLDRGEIVFAGPRTGETD